MPARRSQLHPAPGLTARRHGRVWILLPAKPADHISGVRLYAFHHLGDKLTCTELKFGMLEAVATLDQLSAASHGGAIDETARTQLRLVQSAADCVRNDLTDTHDLRCAKRTDC